MITPSVRGCQTAGSSAYFCDYVQKIVLNDPTFGADEDTRAANFNRGGYKIYTTLDLQLQQVAEDTIDSYVPQVYSRADIGGVLVGVQPGTGRVLYMAQNKQYSQDPDVIDPGRPVHLDQLRDRPGLRRLERLPGRLHVQGVHPRRMAEAGPLPQ